MVVDKVDYISEISFIDNLKLELTYYATEYEYHLAILNLLSRN